MEHIMLYFNQVTHSIKQLKSIRMSEYYLESKLMVQPCTKMIKDSWEFCAPLHEWQKGKSWSGMDESKSFFTTEYEKLNKNHALMARKAGFSSAYSNAMVMLVTQLTDAHAKQLSILVTRTNTMMSQFMEMMKAQQANWIRQHSRNLFNLPNDAPTIIAITPRGMMRNAGSWMKMLQTLQTIRSLWRTKLLVPPDCVWSPK